MNCRICGTEQSRSFQYLGFEWQRCSKCKAVIKVLTEEQYAALNPSYDPGNYYDGEDIKEIVAGLGVMDKKELIRRHIGKDRSPAGLRLLDIGCGMGGYLLAAKELGMEVLGIEPSSDHSRVAKELLGLPVINDYFSAAKVAPQQFDFVVLSHVIEHILNPESFLREILKVLRPGGTLLVVTPNSDSSYYLLLGRFWSMLKPIDHVSLLSEKSFSFMHLPNVSAIEYRQSEYTREFVATLVSGVLSIKRYLTEPRDNGNPVGYQQVLNQPGSMKAKVLKNTMTVLSAPFHLLNVLFHKQGCLIVTIRKEVVN